MPWVKLDDGFFSNPKVIQAPPHARLLYVAGLCHCASGLTDGRITKAAMPLLNAQTGATAKMAKELVRIGLWHDQGDHFEVHDWSLFNQTAADISERREAERRKKARQRAAGTKAVEKGEGGRFVSRGDNQGDSSRDSPGDTRGESPATRPDPTFSTSSSNNSSGVEPAVDGAGAPPEEDHPRTPERTATLAIEHMARCDLRTAEAAGTPIRQPDRWLTKATETRRAAHHHDLVQAATERPNADPVTLAEEIDPACGPDDGGLARAKAEAAKSARAAEDQAARRAENAAWREQANAILEGLDTDDFTALADQARETNPTLLRHEMRRLAMEHHAPQETAAP